MLLFGLFLVYYDFFSNCLLSIHYKMKYDDVHIHMTRAFGLFIIYSGIALLHHLKMKTK